MARHVRISQLLSRLFLSFRRSWRSRHADRYRLRMSRAAVPEIVISDDLPEPVFPARQGMISAEPDGFSMRLLNRVESFSFPVNWHPRHLEHGKRLWKLHLHYMEYLEEVSDEDFVALTHDWILNNPPYRPGYWLDNWNSYALAIRCVVWMQQYAIRCRGFDATFDRLMLESLFRQIEFLSRNLETDIGGNHIIKNIKALLWAGRFFDNDEAGGWESLGRSLLNRELDEQILGDGMHYERSPAYHGQVFADLVECYTVLAGGQLKNRVRSVLRDMAQVVVDTTHPDGQTSLFNDGGLNMTYEAGTALDAWQRVTGDSVDVRSVFYLQNAGYCGFRDGNEFVLADCGQIAPDHLPAHGHGDIFAFEWSIDGRRIFIDTGVYEYDAGPKRDYSRSTAAHNTVTLDGLDQCEFWSSFRVARRAKVYDVRFSPIASGFTITGTHDGYTRLPGKPVHRRTIHAHPGRLHVVDVVEGGRSQFAEARLLLHPDCKVEFDDDVVIIRRDGVIVRLETNVSVDVSTAPWYPDFGVELTCPQLTLHYGKAPCRGEFRLERAPSHSRKESLEYVDGNTTG